MTITKSTVRTPTNPRTGEFTESETTDGLTPASVELSLTSKGTYTWSLKEYVGAGAIQTDEGRAAIVDGLAKLDTLLRERFGAAGA